VTFTYPKDLLDQWVYVILTVSDGKESTSQVIAIKVTSNHPPVKVKDLPDVTLFEREFRPNVFDLDDYFTDPNQDVLFFSYGFSHITVTINTDHTVDMKAEGQWSGEEYVTFRATDPTGAMAEDTILVTVIPVNDPPVLEPLPPLKVHFDYPYDFDLLPYVSDPDDDVNDLVVTTDSPGQVTVRGLVLTLLYPSSFPLDVPIPLTVTVSDGIDSVFRSTTVTVTNNYPPRLIKTLPDVSFPEDTVLRGAFNLGDYFLDNDSAYIIYTSGHENVRVTINADNSTDFSAPTNWSGIELVTFRATDNRSAIKEDTIVVTVVPVNDAPEIKPIPRQAREGVGSWILDLSPYIIDSDNNITEIAISTEDHPRVRAVQQFLLFDYPQPMTESVVIRVSDGILSTEAIIEVEVLGPNPILTFLPWILSGVLAASIYLALKHLRTNIEEVFLVHENGLPIAHLSRTLTPERDPDLIASMFTAVQSFARDSFRGTGAGEIHSMELGGHRVAIAHGQLVYLAVLFRGRREGWVQRRAKDVLQEVERKFGGQLERWTGMMSEVEGIRQFLETFYRAKEAGGSPVFKRVRERVKAANLLQGKEKEESGRPPPPAAPP
jgi:predicted regulator of Ras-like GTPase activity (Roadblock/LC7/MglB family)